MALRLGGLLVLLAASAGLPAPALAQSSSTSYVLQQSTAGAAGTTSESASYALVATAGQAAGVGASSSKHYVLQSGFWGFVGSGLVPVYLTVSRNAGDPAHVDLSWSGNNPPYDVYQATDCSDVFGSFFGSALGNAVTDIPAPASGLVCYSVLATAPGPVPPLGDGR